MTDTCPECGASVDFDTRAARIRSGTCGSGHRSTIVLEDGQPVPGGGTGPETEEVGAQTRSREDLDDPESEEARSPEEGTPCPSCGESLSFRPAGDSGVEAHCAGCGSTFAYVLATGGEGRERRRNRGDGKPVRDERGGFDRPRGRPCRECGGQIRFSTGPEGMVTGECQSCGNRFTLPARRDRDQRGGPRGDREGFVPRYRQPGRPIPGWNSRGGPRDFRGGRASFGRGGPRRDERNRRRRGSRSD